MNNRRRSITSRKMNSTSVTNTNMFAMPLQSTNTFGTMNTTHTHNQQFKEMFTSLSKDRQVLQDKVSSLPLGDDSFRNQGVSIGWKYERAEIELGGKGSIEWNDAQRRKILDSEPVRDAEGHHINSVSEDSSLQANPDNIKFMKNRQEHLAEHDGSWRNATKGDLIDRDARVNKLNTKRVMSNELKGIGLAAAIGLGIGFTIGAVTILAQQGITVDSITKAAGEGLKTGVESSILAMGTHVLVRGIGETIITSLIKVSTNNLKFKLTENLVRACNLAVIGSISAIVFSSWALVKSKRSGQSTSESLKVVGKGLVQSLGVLYLSVVAQGIWGGHAGLIVSLGIGLSMISFQFVKMQLDKQLYAKLQQYSIQESCPAF